MTESISLSNLLMQEDSGPKTLGLAHTLKILRLSL